MNHAERISLARRLRDAAFEVVSKTGRLVEVEGASGAVNEATRGSLHILVTTPRSGARGTPGTYGVDVWADGQGKVLSVLSVWWELLQIVALKMGGWMRELVEDA
jgi:hypothetical protein